MKTQQTTIINIDSPCTECWSSMTPNDLGKFCPKCQTDVWDFTDLSDTEILHVLEHCQGKICGRFRKEQLNRPLIAKQEKTSNHSPRYKSMLAAAILLSATGGSLYGQSNSVKQPLPTVSNNSPQEIDNDNTINRLPKKKPINKILSGRILDKETKEPLIGVSIVLSESNISAISDLDGKFSLMIPDDMMKKEYINFGISYLGYEKMTLNINTAEVPKNKDYTLKEDTTLIMGEVMVVPYNPYPDPIYNKRKRR